MHWRELGEVENEYTSYYSRLFAIFVPKIIRFGGSLTYSYNNNNVASFLRHGVESYMQHNTVTTVDGAQMEKDWFDIAESKPRKS